MKSGPVIVPTISKGESESSTLGHRGGLASNSQMRAAEGAKKAAGVSSVRLVVVQHRVDDGDLIFSRPFLRFAPPPKTRAPDSL